MSSDPPPSGGNDLRAGVVLLLALFAFSQRSSLPQVADRLGQNVGCLVLLTVGIATALGIYGWNRWVDGVSKDALTLPGPDAVVLGEDEKNRLVAVKQRFRRTHAQVIGTTSAGKTESVILPWAIHDVENGGGLLIVDGKSDSLFRDKLYGHVCRAGRRDDFRFFSLASVGPSSTFNPLANGSALEVTERVMGSFQFENEYYRDIQYTVFLMLVRFAQDLGRVPSFALIQKWLEDAQALEKALPQCQDLELRVKVLAFLRLAERDRIERVSGLVAKLSAFTTGETAVLFNAEVPQIDFTKALRENQILYFQLPTMFVPFLAQATGKLVLQCFQGAVARRHLGLEGRAQFFSCFLDDFQDYIYPGFGTLLNKAQSANVGVVFSHQALGDLDNVSPAFRNIVLTNTNIKVVMRSNNPETCEYFAKSFGTRSTVNTTQRTKKEFLHEVKTGDGSARDVEEYVYHPNIIRNLGTGEGIVAIPHPKGVTLAKVRFGMRESAPHVELPQIKKSNAVQPQAEIQELPDVA